MIYSPQYAVDQGWISGLLNPEKQISSDGIDLTLKRVSRVQLLDPSLLTESKQFTVHRQLVPVETQRVDGWEILPDGMIGYDLTAGVYDIEFNEFVRLPQGVAALLLLRSSFVRAGHQMFSGLYDQGFSNYAGAVLHVAGATFIEADMRVAQIIFMPSAGSGQMYAGGYNFVEGDATWQDAAARAQIDAARLPGPPHDV